MSTTALRLVAAVTLALSLAFGWWLSGKTRREAERRVEEFQAVAASGEPRSEPGSTATTMANDPVVFAQHVAEDLESFGLPPLPLTELARPNSRTVELKDAMTLSPGRSWSSPHLRIRASTEKLTYQQSGAKVTARHAIATVENISDKPVAYHLRLRSDSRGKCEVRGVRMHNAIALRPKESAEIAVCAGGGKIRIEWLEIMEITELGYYYLSQLPAAAVGHDATTAAGHRPLVKVSTCESISGLGELLRSGSATWADIVDFYSRHNCHRFEFFVGYRHTPVPLPRLPATPGMRIPDEASGSSSDGKSDGKSETTDL